MSSKSVLSVGSIIRYDGEEGEQREEGERGRRWGTNYNKHSGGNTKNKQKSSQERKPTCGIFQKIMPSQKNENRYSLTCWRLQQISFIGILDNHALHQCGQQICSTKNPLTMTKECPLWFFWISSEKWWNENFVDFGRTRTRRKGKKDRQKWAT